MDEVNFCLPIRNLAEDLLENLSRSTQTSVTSAIFLTKIIKITRRKKKNKKMKISMTAGPKVSEP